jgi:hypothetical protein
MSWMAYHNILLKLRNAAHNISENFFASGVFHDNVISN